MLQAPDPNLSKKIEEALGYIRGLDGTVVALSAGVDSSLVAFLSKRALGRKTVAVTGVSESLSPEELNAAKRVASEIGIEHFVVETSELSNPSYLANSGDRCYYCKQTLYVELEKVARRLGYDFILDGTQTDDMLDFRPGLKAAREAGVKSPLLHAGFTKKDVREAARWFGLSVWDKPAMPCLSSRLPVGESVTVEKLRMVDKAEAFIRNTVPIRELRVRYDNGAARIEVLAHERSLFFQEELMTRIDGELRKLGFLSISLDLRGYSRSGSSRDYILPMRQSTDTD